LGSGGWAGEQLLEGFDAVVDASGSYGNHNWIGMGGVPAVGERSLAGKSEQNVTSCVLYFHPGAAFGCLRLVADRSACSAFEAMLLPRQGTIIATVPKCEYHHRFLQ
jgi:hypothetical protein